MVEEVTSLSGVITDIGIPVAFFMICLYILIKLVPDWVKIWKTTREAEQKHKEDEQKSMQEYYNERNKTYQQQMEIMNRQTEMTSNLVGQATQVIARSNEVIAGNTEALKQNTAMHEKVQDALKADIEATKDIYVNLKDHDARSQKIYTNVQRVLDKMEILKGGNYNDVHK